MPIKIGTKDTGPFPTAFSDAHFFRVHDTYGRETDEGEGVYELPAEVMASYLIKNKDDPEALDSLCCVLANAGVSVNLSLLLEGATDPADLFKRQADHSWLKDARGQEFLLWGPLHMARQLAHHHRRVDRPRNPDDSKAAQAQLDILSGLCKELGLEPNHQRIKADFCRDCHK